MEVGWSDEGPGEDENEGEGEGEGGGFRGGLILFVG